MAKTIIVTGANRGIGLGLAKCFAKSGHQVIATARDPDKASELKALAKEFAGQIAIETLDVKSDLSVKGFAKKCEEYKAIDTLVNNAGILLDSDSKFAELDLKLVADTFDVNTIGVMRVTQALLPVLLRSKSPAVASITSRMGSIEDNTSGGYYGYRISKTALNSFNRSFSVDFPQIVATVFHPGWVQTDMGGSSAPTQVEDSAKGLAKLIETLSKEHTGRFYDFRGEELPW